MVKSITRGKYRTVKDVVNLIDDKDYISSSNDDNNDDEESSSSICEIDDDAPKATRKARTISVKKRTPTRGKLQSRLSVEQVKSVRAAEDEVGSDVGTDAEDTFDVILPASLGSGNTGECTLLIQVDPEDAALLDYEGISGAIGRFEADERGVVLDLKGCQYHGSILPGPTALVVGLSKGGQLRVEGMTDEFASLVQTQDVMAMLDAVVEGQMDDGFRVTEENVNTTSTVKDASAENSCEVSTKNESKATNEPVKQPPVLKRALSKTKSQQSAKRRKTR